MTSLYNIIEYLVTPSTAWQFEIAVMSATIHGIILAVVEVDQVH